MFVTWLENSEGVRKMTQSHHAGVSRAMSRFITLLAFITSIYNVESFSMYGSRKLSGRYQGLPPQKLPQHTLLASKARITPKISMVTTDRPVAALPMHKQLIEGKLDNGFSYVILPNQVPAGRFEAHLEVLSGSAHELDQQQGISIPFVFDASCFSDCSPDFLCRKRSSLLAVDQIFITSYCFINYSSFHFLGIAHLLEHVAYMGSPKRQLISGTGSRTNAYTDFHHTVFFAACPTQTPDQFWYIINVNINLDFLTSVS